MKNNKRVGVGLSGGGYRAAAFHIGTLKKLDSLQILSQVDVLSTISGGSITGAAYCLHCGDFKSFETKMVDALTTKSVIGYVLTSWLFFRAVGFTLIFLSLSVWLLFTKWAPLSILPLILLVFLLIRYQFKILPVSRIIEKAYDQFFFKEAIMSGLRDRPELAIGSTNLQTSRPFTFSKRKMEDSAYAYYKPAIVFDGSNFPVARAVMASSCVPFAFTPVSIDPVYFKNFDAAVAANIDPKLVDGGVYDNQGVQKITQLGSSYACDIILVSDAGNKLPFEQLYNNTLTLLLRTVDTFMIRIKNFQMAQNIFQKPNTKEVAYQSLGWDLDNSVPGFYDNLVKGNLSAQVIAAHRLPEDWALSPQNHKADIISFMEKKCHWAEISARSLTADQMSSVRRIGTNLTKLKPELVTDMIVHAENMTELQLRLYCPTLIN
jgi:NTE family protein